jgi:hypothetical protein
VLDGDTARRILVGLLVGAIDTTAPAVPRIIYVLASIRPCSRAPAPHDPMMTGWCWERCGCGRRQLFCSAARSRQSLSPAARYQAARWRRSLGRRCSTAASFRCRGSSIRRDRCSARTSAPGCTRARDAASTPSLPELVSRLRRHDIAAVGKPRFVGPFIDKLVVTVGGRHRDIPRHDHLSVAQDNVERARDVITALGVRC